MESRRVLRNFVDIAWRPELAYVVGLMASDGYLRADNKEIGFTSKDRELVDLFKQSVKIDKEPYRSGRGGTTQKDYWTFKFKSRNFHDFLVGIGITPRKSKTIQSVLLPDKYFSDFLRGLFDGDGTFWTWWDRRWVNSFGYNMGLSTASVEFALWLKSKASKLYGVKGYVCRGAGVYTIRYTKGDSRLLFQRLYYKKDLICLQRKYIKIKTALDFDEALKGKRKKKVRIINSLIKQNSA